MAAHHPPSLARASLGRGYYNENPLKDYLILQTHSSSQNPKQIKRATLKSFHRREESHWEASKESSAEEVGTRAVGLGRQAGVPPVEGRHESSSCLGGPDGAGEEETVCAPESVKPSGPSQPWSIWEERSDLIRCGKVSRKTQHSACEMAFDSRFHSGFKDLCAEREKVQRRQERGEGKKAERDGERRRKQARGRRLEERKEKKCERSTKPGRVLKSDHSSSLGLSVGKGRWCQPRSPRPCLWV